VTGHKKFLSMGGRVLTCECGNKWVSERGFYRQGVKWREQ